MKVTVIVEEYGYVLVRTSRLVPNQRVSAINDAAAEAVEELVRAGTWQIKESAAKQFTPGGDTAE